jgi:hypothetical protein
MNGVKTDESDALLIEIRSYDCELNIENTCEMQTIEHFWHLETKKPSSDDFCKLCQPDRDVTERPRVFSALGNNHSQWYATSRQTKNAHVAKRLACRSQRCDVAGGLC